VIFVLGVLFAVVVAGGFLVALIDSLGYFFGPHY
jgi:hypothetical protein